MRNRSERKGVFMKNMILTAFLLALTLFFAGCDKANAQHQKNGAKAKNPAPQAILVIDEVAYVDGCKGCDCVEEDVCVCEAKADCECCRKHLKKVPEKMQQKCKEMKKAHAKKTADCNDCKKDGDGKTCSVHNTKKSEMESKK